MSQDTKVRTPWPSNEPIHSYLPESAETKRIQAVLKSKASEKVDIPCIIDGEEVRTGNCIDIIMPHSRQQVLGKFHLAGDKELQKAADSAVRAQKEWASLKWSDRAAVFLKAADLLSGEFRDELNSTTMLAQSKNIFQAEIDAACELIDFFKFNAKYYEEILAQQPVSSPGCWNYMDYRPLEGFVCAITPFNFTSIAANLGAAPAMVGNAVVWKPSHTQVYSAYATMKLFEKAGVPKGLINMVAAEGPDAGRVLLSHNQLAGVHFTGSTATFRSIYRAVGENISNYRSYPRVVGETGGKDFVFAHPSANGDELVTALVRGAFEYQGQKCSAASRAYIPKSIWSKIETPLVDMVKTIKMGDVQDFSNFMNAVIDERAFKKISSYLEEIKNSSDAEFLTGGEAKSDEGFFVQPTIAVTSNPRFKTMVEEIFGPVLTVYVYDDAQLEETLDLCDQASPYALTGAVFGKDRDAVSHVAARLRNTAGNFYINDKPTGAVVGQQPFGGGRASGTNDKAGSILNLYRWISPRTIKENFVPPTDYRYPFMG